MNKLSAWSTNLRQASMGVTKSNGARGKFKNKLPNSASKIPDTLQVFGWSSSKVLRSKKSSTDC